MVFVIMFPLEHAEKENLKVGEEDDDDDYELPTSKA